MSVTRAAIHTQPLPRHELYGIAQAMLHRATADRRRSPERSDPWRSAAEKLARAVLAHLKAPPRDAPERLP